jgi:hypothetical protein
LKNNRRSFDFVRRKIRGKLRSEAVTFLIFERILRHLNGLFSALDFARKQ